MQKAVIRKKALARRDALGEEERRSGSEKIARNLAALFESVPATGPVGVYLPIRSEVDTEPVLAGLKEAGLDTALPVVVDRETIVFRKWAHGDPVDIAGFGTMGPPEDAPVLDPRVLLMPLSAFDPSGNRLGYGAGHYDRAIWRLQRKGIDPLLIGLAFSVQEEAELPAESHDQKLHHIVTEKGWRQFGSAA